MQIISIHALLAESDESRSNIVITSQYFYPRSPCGERQAVRSTINEHRTFLSTLSLRRATLKRLRWLIDFIIFLSTLSLRRATLRNTSAFAIITFLSTLSLRRATAYCQGLFVLQTYFYPRSPCGERPPPKSILVHYTAFLSTLSLRRATFILPFDYIIRPYFYPRSPCGERPLVLDIL